MVARQKYGMIGVVALDYLIKAHQDGPKITLVQFVKHDVVELLHISGIKLIINAFVGLNILKGIRLSFLNFLGLSGR